MSEREHLVTMTPIERINLRVWIHWQTWRLAIADIGKGEEGHNNGGRWLEEEVRPNDGTHGDPDTDKPWCASWVSAKHVQSIRLAREFFGIPGLQLGFRTSRSALRLGERMSEFCRIVTPEEADEGDVFIKRRDGGGHTGFIRARLVGGRLPTLEGNVGRFPAVVKPLSQDPADLELILRYRQAPRGGPV